MQERFREAIEALQTALAQQPKLLEAHQQLARLYQQQGNSVRASMHLELAMESQSEQSNPATQARRASAATVTNSNPTGAAARPTTSPGSGSGTAKFSHVNPEEIITIVTGLPRSGTSLLMQLLEAGGLEPLTDGSRTADANNPKGYYEYEPVKHLAASHTWLEQARGKAVKIVYPLVLGLPPGHHYRLLFLERPLNEVLDSQQAMLNRAGEAAENASQLRAHWEQALRSNMELLGSRHDCELIRVSHRALVTAETEEIRRLFDSLVLNFIPERVLAMIRPELYRSRRE